MMQNLRKILWKHTDRLQEEASSLHLLRGQALASEVGDDFQKTRLNV